MSEIKGTSLGEVIGTFIGIAVVVAIFASIAGLGWRAFAWAAGF